MPPWEGGGIATQQPHVKMLAFPLGSHPLRPVKGERRHGGDMGTCVPVFPPDPSPLEGQGWGQLPTTSLLQLQLCLWHL